MFLSNHHSENSFQPGDDLNIEESENVYIRLLIQMPIWQFG